MEHVLLKAAATATTDQGEFTAIAAAYTVDRVKDRIVPGAFKATIERWQLSGKQIPLHWNHEGDPKSIIGTIDPASMQETDEGLFVKGRVDLADSEMAREAWRSMKNGSMSLSFGYLVEKSNKAKDGVTDLLAIDLFEVSIVPAPANADTRVLSLKALTEQGIFSADELQAAVDGDLKAVWTAAYVNSLPDSSFLYIEPGASKDDEGRTTPRSLRHFPVKDADGNIDLPHLRNALARIPQSSLSQDVKDRLTAKAQRMLDAQKSVDESDTEGPSEARSGDSLRTTALRLVQDIYTRGLDAEPPPKQAPPPKPTPEMSPARLRQEARALLIQVLSKTQESHS